MESRLVVVHVDLEVPIEIPVQPQAPGPRESRGFGGIRQRLTQFVVADPRKCRVVDFQFAIARRQFKRAPMASNRIEVGIGFNAFEIGVFAG